MKPYIKNGKIIYNKNKPPTDKEWREVLLCKYIQDDMKLYADIISILSESDYEDTISHANERIATLARARYELIQKQPPDLVAKIIGVHYNELLHQYI